MRRPIVGTLVVAGVLLSAGIAFAWTGPSASPPGSNTTAPINIGTVTQSKNGTLGVDGLVVFGNTLLGGSLGSNAYLNFGATAGTSGYGIWDNNGTLEFKNSGGSWSALQSTSTIQSIIYSYCGGGSCGGGGTITGVTAGTNMTGGGTSGNVTLSTSLAPAFNDVYVNNWFRVNAGGGLYWQTYGGSVQQYDGTWVRVSPYLYVGNGYDSGGPSGAGCGGGLGGGYTFHVCGSSDASEVYTNDNLYLGYLGNWISSYLNQPVTTSSNPTFGDVYTTNVYSSARGMWMSESARDDGGQFWTQEQDGSGQCPSGSVLVGLSGTYPDGASQYYICQWIN